MNGQTVGSLAQVCSLANGVVWSPARIQLRICAYDRLAMQASNENIVAATESLSVSIAITQRQHDKFKSRRQPQSNRSGASQAERQRAKISQCVTRGIEDRGGEPESASPGLAGCAGAMEKFLSSARSRRIKVKASSNEQAGGHLISKLRGARTREQVKDRAASPSS
jgi:hypothetical protein